MDDKQKLIESNQRLKEAVEALLQQLEVDTSSAIKLPNSTSRWKRLKNRLIDSLERMLFNIIDDLPTTLTGFAFAAFIIISEWPEIDATTLAQAFGFGTLGAIGTSKGMKFYADKLKKRQPND